MIFDTLQPVKPGEIVECRFQFEPSATYFRAGDELRLVVQGQYFINSLKINQPFTYLGNEKGSCTIHASLTHPSALLLPMIVK
jgi:predicted acyl esterase